MVKIGVLVSGGGTNLQALIDAERSGIIKSGKISLVISNKKDAYALQRAKDNGIEWLILENDDPVPDGISDITRSMQWLKANVN